MKSSKGLKRTTIREDVLLVVTASVDVHPVSLYTSLCI
jgi:hypothetical protein